MKQKPTEPGFYWVLKSYGIQEWLPACLGSLGGVQVFGDVEFGDGSDVAEWGPRIKLPPSVRRFPRMLYSLQPAQKTLQSETPSTKD